MVSSGWEVRRVQYIVACSGLFKGEGAVTFLTDAE